MKLSLPVVLSAVIALAVASAAASTARSWLDSSALEAWNAPASVLPFAPQGPRNPDPRCHQSARSADSDEDRQVRARGWDLIGQPTAAWQIRVIGATADYDGMCRPRRYQYFVFRQGAFVGTLSPDLMESRTDGALTHVTVESATRLRADYARYDEADPLCCPSRRTTVLFSLEETPPRLTARSARSVATRPAPQESPGPAPAATPP